MLLENRTEKMLEELNSTSRIHPDSEQKIRMINQETEVARIEMERNQRASMIYAEKNRVKRDLYRPTNFFNKLYQKIRLYLFK